MKIYLYDKETKEYLGSKEAEADPEETRRQGKFIPLVPANAVLSAPPEFGEDQIPIYTNNGWIIQEDLRKNYVKVNDELQVFPITRIGEQEGYYIVTAEEGIKIQTNPDEYKINGNKIIKKTQEEIREFKRQERKKLFQTNFFETSLGWIKRTVTMKNGEQKDFLSDLLLSIKAGIEMGENVKIIVYRLPDFNNELSEEYLISLQEQKIATEQFIKECLLQNVKDFNYGKED